MRVRRMILKTGQRYEVRSSVYIKETPHVFPYQKTKRKSYMHVTLTLLKPERRETKYRFTGFGFSVLGKKMRLEIISP